MLSSSLLSVHLGQEVSQAQLEKFLMLACGMDYEKFKNDYGAVYIDFREDSIQVHFVFTRRFTDEDVDLGELNAIMHNRDNFINFIINPPLKFNNALYSSISVCLEAVHFKSVFLELERLIRYKEQLFKQQISKEDVTYIQLVERTKMYLINSINNAEKIVEGR